MAKVLHHTAKAEPTAIGALGAMTIRVDLTALDFFGLAAIYDAAGSMADTCTAVLGQPRCVKRVTDYGTFDPNEAGRVVADFEDTLHGLRDAIVEEAWRRRYDRKAFDASPQFRLATQTDCNSPSEALEEIQRFLTKDAAA